MRAFSARTSWDTSEGALAAAIREGRSAGRSLIDLTGSNPTRCGFHYEQNCVLGALSDPAGLVYDPDPRGMRSARQAVAAYYAAHAARLDPDDLLLTTSTSEAYSFLFRLLCDPGDEVLVAQPSYPLFDFLADLESIRLIPYPLFHDFGWWIDFAELERRITARTRVVLLVHPNNPTGHVTARAERHTLEQLCVRHGLALVVDEVFLDFSLSGPMESFAVGPHPCLTFVVSGLSKIAALPQMKVGWLACFGPESLLAEAKARLEIIADTFLSLNAPAQHALPVWLAGRQAIEQQIVARCRKNLQLLEAEGLAFYPVEAGWSAILRLEGWAGSSDLAVTLVREAGVIVHPGSFYGMHGSNRVVVSLIGPEETFAIGVEKMRSLAAQP